MKIFQAQTSAEIGAARDLFREYETALGVDLCFQNFEQELSSLPGKYEPPDGRLLLAAENEQIAGCIALRKLNAETGEMKRLYVRSQFRGNGLGAELILRLIEEARSIGYRKMYLDTLSEKMPAAIRLYKNLGFQEIAAYYDSPRKDTVFFCREL